MPPTPRDLVRASLEFGTTVGSPGLPFGAPQDKSSIAAAIRGGDSVCVMPGGIAEMVETDASAERLILQGRQAAGLAGLPGVSSRGGGGGLERTGALRVSSGKLGELWRL